MSTPVFNKGADLANQLIMNNVVVRRGVKEALKSGGRAVPMDLMAAYAAFTANLVAEKDLRRKLQSIEKEEKIRMREIHTEKLALRKEFEEQEGKYWGCPRVFSAESFFSDSDAYRREVYTGPEPTKARIGRKRLETLRNLLRFLASEDDMLPGLKRPRSTGKNVAFSEETEEPFESRPVPADTKDGAHARNADGLARPERIKSAPTPKQKCHEASRGGQAPRAHSAWTGRGPGARKERGATPLRLEVEHELRGKSEQTDVHRLGSARGTTRPGSVRESPVEEAVAGGTGIASGGISEKSVEVHSGSSDTEFGATAQADSARNRKYTRRASAPVRRSSNVKGQMDGQVTKWYTYRRHTLHSSEIPKFRSHHVAKSSEDSARPASARETILARHGELILGRESSVGPHSANRRSPEVSCSQTPECPPNPEHVTTAEVCKPPLLSASESPTSTRKEIETTRPLDSSDLKATDAIKPTSKVEIEVASKKHRRGSKARSHLVGNTTGRKGSVNQRMQPSQIPAVCRGPRGVVGARRDSAVSQSVILARDATKSLSCHAKPLAPRTCERCLHQSHPENRESSPRTRRASIFRRKSLSASLYGEQIQVESNLRQKVHAFLETQDEHVEEENDGAGTLDGKLNESKPVDESWLAQRELKHVNTKFAHVF